MNNSMNEQYDEQEAEMDTLMSMLAGLVVRGVGADEFCNHAPTLIRQFAPSLIPASVPAEECDRGLRLMARQFWNQMPQPNNDFRPLPLPEPERNSPCVCGSGEKYKHCCLGIEREIHKQWQTMPLLPFVLSALPKNALAKVPVLHLPTDLLQMTMEDWQYESPESVIKLLELAFEDVSKMHDKHAWMYGALCGAYDALNKPRKKQQLQQLALSAQSRQLRSDALQHQVTQLSDRGDFAGAWQSFQQAMRTTPDDPHLSHLEVLILQSEGKPDMARERAQYWIQKLKRDKKYDHSYLIDALEQLSMNPAALHYKMATSAIPELELWTRAVQQLPAPELHYQLQGDDSMAELQADAALRKVEKQWNAIFPGQKPMLTHMEVPDHPGLDELDKWPDWLLKHPLAWQSFEIIDDVVLLLTALPVPPEAIQTNLLQPILQHADALWQQLLTNKLATQTIPWGCLGNRPALRVLAQKVLMHFHSGQETEHAAALELMLALNPTDNHGFRDELSSHYLRHGQLDRALNLHAQYPDDGADMSYNRVLACYASGKESEARKFAQHAVAEFPEICKMLLAKNPKQPKLQHGFVKYGGKDEAWFYREAMLAQWIKYDALDWLRKI